MAVQVTIYEKKKGPGQTLTPLYLSWIGGAVSFLLSAWMFVASKK